MKVKEQVNSTLTTAKRVVLNGEQFLQASALVVLVGFSWYALHKLHTSNVTSWVITVALVICGLRAFVEYIRFLDR